MDFLNGSLHHQEQQRPGEGGWLRTPAGSHEAADENGLTERDYASLEARWISREFASRAQLRRVDSVTGAATVGRKSGDYAGVLIPYFQPGSDRVREFRLRRDHPELEYDSSSNLKERNKYLSPPGRANMLYIVPETDPEVLRDPTIPVVVTEGEFKTLALCRAAEHRSPNVPRFLAIGFTGGLQLARDSPSDLHGRHLPDTSGAGGRLSAFWSGIPIEVRASTTTLPTSVRIHS